MDGGYLYSDFREYLDFLGYGPEHKIGNSEMWENAEGKTFNFSTFSNNISAPHLDEMLRDLGKGKEDFDLFLKARVKLD